MDSLLKTKKEYRILKKQEIQDIFIKNKLDKFCCQHNMACRDFKDLLRTATDKLLRDKAFHIAKNPKYDEYQRKLTSLLFNFFDKRSSGNGAKSKIMPNW